MTTPNLKLGDTATWRTYPGTDGPLHTGAVIGVISAGTRLSEFMRSGKVWGGVYLDHVQQELQRPPRSKRP